MSVSVLVLAAGQGLRMRSSIPKVLHHLAGRPLIRYSIETARAVSLQKPVVVVAPEAGAIRCELGDDVEYVIQTPQLGTGHAVQAAETLLRDAADQLVVISADMPLLTSKTLHNMLELQLKAGSVMTLLSIHSEIPLGFGRLVRDANGQAAAIVEETQATPEQLTIRELNAGAYCFDTTWLWLALKNIKISPRGEFYLTDLLEIAIQQGDKVQVYTLQDASEAIGINTRVHLAEAESLLRKQVNTHLMISGVTLIDPSTTYIEPGIKVGRDTIIYPNTHLRGDTIIGESCVIGPNTIIEDTSIGARCTVLCSVLESATLEDDVEMGPFGHLRKGAHLASGVHMGNFGEIKNSYLGPETKMGHFSYIGDAQIGANVNIGAGTITCNYDGEKKHKTELADGVFVGSDTMLVAPVKMGEGARSGAGAVVTKDVPAHTTVVGVPARPLIKKETSG
jgi:bifunctional UDP-N-acetylglucosamine pyrophosphorylase/glucosamine-1-phosphate N-acetyltransferase